jgi:CDP-6-deoxy-D-xylo-4-hexulose-3-dehydrase
MEDLRAQISALVKTYARDKFKETIFIPGETPIPPSGKLIGEDELQYMVEASLDGWLTTGRFNETFQEKLANVLGVKFLLTVNSGSSANLVAFNTLTSPRLGSRAIKKGDEVITVAAGFPTTVNPILQFGAVPVFVDVDMATHNIDVALIEEAITPKTKAIMLAHTLGNPFDCAAIRRICDDYGLWLVEDCCDALGATFDERMVGSWGDIATLSFYPAHHITMGEGGAVFTNNADLKVIAESFRDWGRDCYCPPGKDNTCNKRFDQTFGSLPDGYDHKYVYSHLGYNLKITDMQAACGVAQLAQLDDFIARRRSNFEYLNDRLTSLGDFLSVAQPTDNSKPSWFGCPITLHDDCGVSRVDVTKFLDSKRIGTRLLFAGNLTRQPYFDGKNYRIASSLENTDRTMKQTFWVGVQPALRVEQLNYIVDQLEEFFGLNF